MRTLPETEYLIVEYLVAHGGTTVASLAEGIGVDQSRVHAACVALAELGLVTLTEETYQELGLDPGFDPERPLPERVVAKALLELGGSAEITELPDATGLDQKTVGQTLRWLRAKGLARQQGKTLVATDEARTGEPGPDEILIRELARRGPSRDSELRAAGVDLAGALKLLEKRKGIVKVRQRVVRRAAPTDRAGELWRAGEFTMRRQVNQLTSDMIQDGSWRDVDFRPYDVTLATARIHPGKLHPFRRILEQTRRVFLELGFTEIVSPMVESSFWDFDALFQPQDHPAREMQDTFYVARPGECRLPDQAYVDAVAATHRDGGETGSVGWRYDWDLELARRPVLRTHSTAATVRALAADPSAPRKVFCIGPVFRRETIDYKHLPVFHQVDGIIIDEQGSFASLLGILDAFYRKMGFDKFTFRPAFFPYTEPSVEVFVWLEERKDWVEMGGAGIFRPEVTEPAGCGHPVLAWGLGLERLAMVRHGLSDIRDLYMADLDWLKGAPLCR